MGSLAFARVSLGLALGLTLGCGAPPPGNQLQADMAGGPDWVRKSCAAFSGEKHAVICGVGVVKGTNNPAIAKSGAEGRARTAIARSLETRVKSMLKDYQSTTGDMRGASDEQYVVDVSKQITNLALSGTDLKDTWVSDTGAWWALVVLDTEAFSSALDGMKQLDEKVRKAIVERAEKAFRELDKETEKVE